MVNIGTNPTGIALYRNEVNSTNNAINQKLWVVSRGERKLQMVTFSSDYNSGSVTKTLQDRNMRDPIKAEENETNGSSVGVLTVVSHEDKSVLQYRYTPLLAHPDYSASQAQRLPDQQRLWRHGRIRVRWPSGTAGQTLPAA